MKLVDNWSQILRKASCVRWMGAATALGAVEVILPLFADPLMESIGRGRFAVCSVLALFAGILSRVIEQQELHA